MTMTGIKVNVEGAKSVPQNMEDTEQNSLPADEPVVGNGFEDSDDLAVVPVAENTVVSEFDTSEIPNAESAMEDDQVGIINERKIHTVNEATFQDNRGNLNVPAMPLPTLNATDLLELLESTEEIMGTLSVEQANSMNNHLMSFPLTGDEVALKFFETASRLNNKMKSPNGTPLVMTNPPYKEPNKSSVLSAEEASAYLAHLQNTYDSAYIICPHSGLWLKVVTPDNRSLSMLQGSMTSHRNALGYQSRGASLSCDSALRNKIFTEWVIERTTKTNMKDSSPEAIAKFLKAPDIPLIAHQMAVCIHPSGYPVERSCSTKKGICTHVERTNMRLSKMIHFDEDRMTDNQRAHLQTALRSASLKSEEQMQAYQDEFSKTISRENQVSANIKVTYTMPSYEIYANTAEDWAAEIRSSSESVIANMTEQEALSHMHQQANLATLTKYAAWVESISLNGRIAESRSAVVATLTRMSSDDEIVKKFVDGVTDYIAACTVAAVGVNDYKCPKCNEKQSEHENGLLSSIAAIDPVNAFFTLAQLKIQYYLSRNSAR